MLDLLHSDHFRAFLDQSLTLQLPDGNTLPIVIDTVTQAPRSAVPGSTRIPFCVTLHSSDPTDFVDGLCCLDLPGTGAIRDLFVTRNPPLGRDPNLAYYSIIFN
ncbi:hypothetical protein ACA097_25165 [Pseudomonas sp. QL9]|uniref:DUF6916 domain-containing protein n=1 Tax=Pseudomonas knackmussii (strain DSM 6978 / CCUG 54928 / LMG 23759 / B13) TaxID=1301098 RepID=A0A024HHT0_PSEKB|nr:hypothetical protein [Pseudomonas knackmussii]CDF84451.1 hypothetical protein PKB_3104 [Pseudomonas knackmussii B13]